MKILATFDGSKFAESSLPLLQQVAALPNAEITLLAVGNEPDERLSQRSRRPAAIGGFTGSTDPAVLVDAYDPQFAEGKSQAIERRIAELQDYLDGLAQQLPKSASVHVDVHLAKKPADVIIEQARQDHVDVIVMATHGTTGITRTLFGSTTEHVLRSGVAPVLLVRPPH